MPLGLNVQLASLLTDNKVETIFKEVKRIYCFYYSKKTWKFINHCFTGVKKLFKGKFVGYKPCNTNYHDLDHTISALLAVIRLVDGYNISKTPFSESLATNLITATLFHDVGYIQEDWDEEGTGAKYTSNHVERSVAFIQEHYQQFHINSEDVDIISNLIKCTGLSADLNSIPFISNEEKVAGSILGTADLLGQMSDRDYLEKLLFLYYEFKEAQIPGFNTEFDILKNTIQFYETIKERLSNSYLSLYKLVQFHFTERFDINKDLYTEAINRHIFYLQRILEDESSNFRHKLKRGEWIHQL